MKLVPFSSNKYSSDTHFIIDEDDYDKVSAYKWRLIDRSSGTKYLPQYSVVRTASKEERLKGAPDKIQLHRFIMGLHLSRGGYDNEIDHINRNQLDNRKSNLRICTRAVNQRNKGNNSNKGIGLWGATFNKARKNNQWQANFHIKGKTYMLGFFSCEIDAHNKAAEEYQKLTGKKPLF